jgi:hypothetical protein
MSKVVGRRQLRRETDPGLRLLALIPVTVLAIAMMWWPEYGDQSLFVLGAQQLREGSVYYRDFWDIKQPGLYWFYQLGDLFIPGGVGARVLEVALVVAAGLLVLSITSQWTLRRWVRIGAPTMVLGPYLTWSYLDGVGQIEGLMNVLILAAIRLTWPRRNRPTAAGSWFAAGLVIGIVVLLKTLYAPLVLVPPAAAFLAGIRSQPRELLGRACLVAAGAFVPVALALGYLAVQGQLGLALFTSFDLPGLIAANPNLHPAGSLDEAIRAIKNMLPVTGPLAAIGLLGARNRETWLRDGSFAFIAVLELILAYPQLWTPYRFLMLSAPVGLLAVLGLESTATWFAARTGQGWWVRALAVAGSLAAAGLTATTLKLPATLLLHAGDHQWGLNTEARISRSDTPANFRAAAVVANRVTPGEQIYVVGDPSVMALLRARQGLELTGWSLEQMPDLVWAEATRELIRSRPSLVYVDDTTQDWTLIKKEQGKAFFGRLDQDYAVLSSTADGTWYLSTDPGTPLPTPDGNQLRSVTATEAKGRPNSEGHSE